MKARQLVENMMDLQHPGWNILKNALGYEDPLDDDYLSSLIAALPPDQQRSVLDDAQRVGEDALTHAALDTWGAFEVTHKDYQSPTPEAMAQITPALQTLISQMMEE